MNIQDWFPLGLTGLISLQSKGLSRVFSNTTVQKNQFFNAQPSFWSNSLFNEPSLWSNRWGKVEAVTDFLFLGPKITVDGDCSHEIKRCLLLGRKAMSNLDSILTSRDITLPTKVRLVKAMVFPVMYGCENWTIKKAECWRIDTFELWCWRRLLRVP